MPVSSRLHASQRIYIVSIALSCALMIQVRAQTSNIMSLHAWLTLAVLWFEGEFGGRASLTTSKMLDTSPGVHISIAARTPQP